MSLSDVSWIWADSLDLRHDRQKLDDSGVATTVILEDTGRALECMENGETSIVTTF